MSYGIIGALWRMQQRTPPRWRDDSGERATSSGPRATVLESLGRTAQALRVAELGDTLEDLLRDLDPAAARAYPGSVEQ